MSNWKTITRLKFMLPKSSTKKIPFSRICWHVPKLLNGFKCEFKLKTIEEQGVGARSLTRNILGQRGMLELWDGIRKSDKHQLLTRTYTKPNTRWLMHSWSTFGVRTNRRQIRTHKTHHGPDLGEATTFPFIVYSFPFHEAHMQTIFCLETPKWESRNFQSWDSRKFWAS